jgi:hypothetical protein
VIKKTVILKMAIDTFFSISRDDELSNQMIMYQIYSEWIVLFLAILTWMFGHIVGLSVMRVFLAINIFFIFTLRHGELD